MINYQHPTRSTSTGVTLVRGQSINLTTSVVTESDTPVQYPGHREGMIMNDLVTFHSLLRCNEAEGHIGRQVPQTREDHIRDGLDRNVPDALAAAIAWTLEV